MTRVLMFQIKAPHFTAGGVVDGKVAPILKYMTGWSWAQILNYCCTKEWAVEFWWAQDD